MLLTVCSLTPLKIRGEGCLLGYKVSLLLLLLPLRLLLLLLLRVG